MGPDRAVSPDVNLADLAEDAGLDQFHQPTRVGVAVALVAHLRGDFVFTRNLGHLARLGHGVGERFLAINVFATLYRGEGRGGVHVVGRGNGHRVDVSAFLLEHDAKILEAFGLGIFFERLRRVGFVHIAKRVNILVIDIGDVAGALSTDADASDVQPVVCAQHISTGDKRETERAGGGDRAFHELAAGEGMGFHNGC